MGMLDGKRAVVTGVGPGLGTEVALGLAREGADVALVARSQRVTPDVAAEIRFMGRRAEVVSANIIEPEDVSRMVDEVGEAFEGRVDILVNSAFRSGDFTSFADADLEKWRKITEVNLWGGLSVTQAMLPLLDAAVDESDDARVVMINTMSIQHIQSGSGAYVASKGGLAGATQVLSRELGPRGIRVNSVHPGYIYGDSVRMYFEMQAESRGDGVTPEDVYAEVASETALGYLPTPVEIAGTVVFLSSPLAKPITGAAIPVNCGHWIPGLA
ncbi:MAG: SDR family oxidoreductase [Microthrixaceae bacterium]